MPFTTREIGRLEDHNVALWHSLGTLTGESGLEIQPFDSGLAVFWPQIPAPLFNRLLGVGRRGRVDRAGLRDLLERYRSNGAPWWVQLPPDLKDASLRSDLADSGLAPQAAGPVLALKPEGWIPPTPAANVSVDLVAPGHELEFAEILVRSFEMAPEVTPWIRQLALADGATNFLGRVHGDPAGSGQLIIAAGAAGLYSGGVLDQFRRRGIHSALVGKRVEAAIGRGYDLIVSETESDGNQSFRDLSRQGFATAFLHEHWGE